MAGHPQSSEVQSKAVAAPKRRLISHDWWAVIAALAAVALVRFGAIPSVGW